MGFLWGYLNGVVSLCLLDGDLRGAVAILLERSVLIGVRLIAIAQVIDECLAQHALALAVDEDDAASLLVAMLGQRLAELVELIVQDVHRRHTSRRV